MAPAHLQALSSKPVLYVANVDEGDGEPPAALVEHARRQDAGCIAVSARIEAELARAARRPRRPRCAPSWGWRSRGWSGSCAPPTSCSTWSPSSRRIAAARRRARALRRGLTAWDAAGKVHTDIQAGFVRAEVIGWRELVEAGGYGEARERGLIRTEGRDYVVRDGDVITIRH